MKDLTEKKKILKAIRDLPENIGIEEAIEHLYFLYKIEKGIEQADAGKKVSHTEAKERLKKWLE